VEFLGRRGNLGASGLRPDRAIRGSALPRSGPACGVAASRPSYPLRVNIESSDVF
jgi:hypothetical protein